MAITVGRVPGSPNNPFLPGGSIAAIKSAHDLVNAINQRIQDVSQEQLNNGAPATAIEQLKKKYQTDRPYSSTDEANARLRAFYNELPTKYNTVDVLNSMYQEALNAGIKNPPKPPSVSNATAYDKAASDSLISSYQQQLQNASTVTTYDISAGIKDVNAQLSKAGITSLPTQPKITSFDSQSSAQSALDSYISQANTLLTKYNSTVQQNTSTQATSYYDVDSSLKQIYNSFLSNGGSKTALTLPSYGKSVTSESQANKIINDYLSKANSALPQAQTTYDVNGALKSAYDSLISAGYGRVVAPTYVTGTYTDQVSAQKVIDDYYSKVQSSGMIDPQTNLDYAVLAGNKSEVARISQILGVRTDVDPQKTSGYRFIYELTDANTEWYQHWLRENPGKTEYDFRRAKAGSDNGGSMLEYSVVKSSSGYTEPQVQGNRNSGNQSALSNPSVAKIMADNASLSTSELVMKLAASGVSTPTVVKSSGSSNSVQLVTGSNALAKYQNAVIAYENKNPGSIVLKDGTVIKNVETSGSRSTGTPLETPVLKVYTQQQYNDAISQAMKTASAYKAAQDELVANPMLTKSGMVINQIEGTGLNALNQPVLIEKNFGSGPQAHVNFYSAIDTAIDAAMSQATINARAAEVYGPKGTLGSTVKNDIETSGQIVYPNINTNSPNALFRWSAEADNMLRNAFSYSSVTKKVTDVTNAADEMVSSKLPTFKEIQNYRDVELSKYPTIQAFQKNGQSVIYSNAVAAEAMDYAMSFAEHGLKHPVSTAMAAGAVIGSGQAFSIGSEIGLSVLGDIAVTGLTRVGAITAAKYAPTVLRSAFNIAVTAQTALAGKNALEGGVDSSIDFAANMALMSVGYRQGLAQMREPITVIPGMREVSVNEVFPGADAKVNKINVGETFAPFGKSLVSHDREGFTLGAPRITNELLGSRMVQPYSELGTKSFDAYVKQSMSELDQAYTFSGRGIASSAYGASEPIIKATKFEISSSEIPMEYKSIVKQAVTEYGKGNLISKPAYQIYGSVAQKTFMGDYLTRQPKDLEISVKNTSKFIESFKNTVSKSGLIEGKDYKINLADKAAPKIEFKIEGKWAKGIEVFSHDPNVTLSDSKGHSTVLNQAFGFVARGSAKVEGVKLMKLQEQAARKLSGATNLKNGEIVLTHSGRIKDVKDLIDIGVGYKVERNVGSAKDIVNFANAAAQKFPELLDKNSKSYSQMIAYLVKNGKLPTKPEIRKMGVELPESGKSKTVGAANRVHERELLAFSEGRNPAKILKSLEESLQLAKSSYSKSTPVSKQSTPKSISKPIGEASTAVKLNKSGSRSIVQGRPVSSVNISGSIGKKGLEEIFRISKSTEPNKKSPSSISISKSPSAKSPAVTSRPGGSKTTPSKSATSSKSKGPGGKSEPIKSKSPTTTRKSTSTSSRSATSTKSKESQITRKYITVPSGSSASSIIKHKFETSSTIHKKNKEDDKVREIKGDAAINMSRVIANKLGLRYISD